MSEPIHPEVRIGHAHLRVGDLERATAFIGRAGLRRYRLGLRFRHVRHGVSLRRGLPSPHRLDTRHSAGGTPPPEGHSGLHHIAILDPNDGSWPRQSSGARPWHGFTYAHQTRGQAVTRRPGWQRVELYYDNPREQWTDEEGKPLVDTLFDIDLIKEMDRKSYLKSSVPDLGGAPRIRRISSAPEGG